MPLTIQAKVGTGPMERVRCKYRRLPPPENSSLYVRPTGEASHGEKWQLVRVTGIVSLGPGGLLYLLEKIR